MCCAVEIDRKKSGKQQSGRVAVRIRSDGSAAALGSALGSRQKERVAEVRAGAAGLERGVLAMLARVGSASTWRRDCQARLLGNTYNVEALVRFVWTKSGPSPRMTRRLPGKSIGEEIYQGIWIHRI